MSHFFYALGGGLGHFSRALRVVDYFAIDAPVSLLVSPHLKDWRAAAPENVDLQFLPESCVQDGDSARAYMETLFTQRHYDRLWLDAFPFGIFGELAISPPDLPITHIARILKHSGWMQIPSPIDFEKTYLVEPVVEAHRRFLKENSGKLSSIDLPLPVVPAPTECFDPFWLLSHTGCQDEVDRLIELTFGAPRVLAATSNTVRLPSRFIRVNSPLPYYRSAEKIISGCGFNTMQETREYRHKHIFLPFKRRFDDQFFRAKSQKRVNGHI